MFLVVQKCVALREEFDQRLGKGGNLKDDGWMVTWNINKVIRNLTLDY